MQSCSSIAIMAWTTESRWVLIVCVATVFIGLCDRVQISVAIIHMALELEWSLTDQGVVLAAFFYGYTLTQVLVRKLTCSLHAHVVPASIKYDSIFGRFVLFCCVLTDIRLVTCLNVVSRLQGVGGVPGSKLWASAGLICCNGRMVIFNYSNPVHGSVVFHARGLVEGATRDIWRSNVSMRVSCRQLFFASFSQIQRLHSFRFIFRQTKYIALICLELESVEQYYMQTNV